MPFRLASSFINRAIAVVIAVIRFPLETIVVRVFIKTMLTPTRCHSRCCISLITPASRLFSLLNGHSFFLNFCFCLDLVNGGRFRSIDFN